MDFAKYDTSKTSETGAELTVLNPETYEETDVKIRLAGTDSSVYRNFIKRRAEERMKQGKKKQQSVDLDKSEREGCELLAACTLGWQNVSEKGQEVEFSKEAAIDLYLKYKWLRDQVDSFIGDRANFFPKSSKA